MATVSSGVKRKSTGDLIVGFINFGKIALSEQIGEIKNIVLDFFAGGLVLAFVHLALERLGNE